MVTYAGDRKLESSDAKIGLVVKWDRQMSLSEFGQLFKDLDSIFNASTKEVSSRLKASNVRRREGSLIVSEYKSGSIEILADPYFQGTVGSLAATAIVAVFTYTLRRFNGKPTETANEPTMAVSSDAISSDKLQTASSESVAKTAPARKRVANLVKTFGIKVTVKFEHRTYEVIG
jgi:hypothetical protein